MREDANRACAACGAPFTPGPDTVMVLGSTLECELTQRCPPCEAARIETLGAVCANCGGPISPNTQVGVLVAHNGARMVCHTTYECSPPGGSFYGFWGEGRLASSFEQIEQC